MHFAFGELLKRDFYRPVHSSALNCDDAVSLSACSYVLMECRCEATRDAAQVAAEIYDEAIAVPYMTALTVFARRQGPLEGRMQLFCMTTDRPAGRSLEKRDDYVKVATLRDVEVTVKVISLVNSSFRVKVDSVFTGFVGSSFIIGSKVQ